MFVPVRGGVEKLQKRTRTILEQQAALATVEIPSVYIFNVGPRVWRGVGGGKEWVIPACKKGEAYSTPVAVPAINLSERDIADGNNNLDVVIDAALSGTRMIGNEEKHVFGVADDIIGKSSTSPGLDLFTTNGEWFGLFVTRNEVPSDEELEAANGKLLEMMDLIYSKGAENVEQGEKVVPLDRKVYNQAAEILHRKSLWGSLDHTMQNCPLCGEDVRKGAVVCKHCNRAIDEASVNAFFMRQQQEFEELAAQLPADPEAENEAEPGKQPPAPQPGKKPAQSTKKNARKN